MGEGSEYPSARPGKGAGERLAPPERYSSPSGRLSLASCAPAELASVSPGKGSVRSSFGSVNFPSRRRAVVEKRLLPAVGDRRIHPILVAQVRNGNPVQQMPPQNGDFLLRRKRPPLPRHVQKLLRGHILRASFKTLTLGERFVV